MVVACCWLIGVRKMDEKVELKTATNRTASLVILTVLCAVLYSCMNRFKFPQGISGTSRQDKADRERNRNKRRDEGKSREEMDKSCICHFLCFYLRLFACLCLVCLSLFFLISSLFLLFSSLPSSPKIKQHITLRKNHTPKQCYYQCSQRNCILNRPIHLHFSQKLLC